MQEEDVEDLAPVTSEAGASGHSMGASSGSEADEENRDDDGAVCFEYKEGFGEGRRARIAPEVPLPSEEMVRRHKASGHCPYWAWCKECVMGACNRPSHPARKALDPGAIPELHGDYAFFRDRPGEKDKTRTVLVMVDRKSSGVCANVVPKKGAGAGFAVKQVHRDIRKFGHRHKVTLRSDGEPAIKSLFEKVANMRAQETLLENSPVGDSRANGRAERAVQTIEKQVRVKKLSTEEGLGAFSVAHPCFPWLVIHAADVLAKYKVLPDGMTSYEKLKMREYSGLTFEFAQKILYKGSAKVQGGVMDARWRTGVWLGKRFASEEHIVGAADGTILRCGAAKPRPDETFNRELFDGIRGSPWNPTGKEGQDGEPPAEHLGD